jgi:hypothetical protein
MATAVPTPVRSPFAPIESFRVVPEISIISIFPLPLRKSIPLAGMIHTFEIPAQKPNQYFRLRVGNSFQFIRDTSDVNQSNPTPGLKPAPVTAQQLADALVTDWTNSISREGAPGVGLLPVGVEEGTQEFKDFLKGLTRQQKQMAEWLVQDASDKHGKHETKSITDFHRACAKWLLGDASAKLPWFPQIDFQGTKRCVACDSEIKAQAKVCQHCNTDLVEYYVKYGLNEAADPAIAHLVERVRLARFNPNDPGKKSGDEANTPASFALTPEIGKFAVSASMLKEVMEVMTDDEKREYHKAPNEGKKMEIIRNIGVERGLFDRNGKKVEKA